jgi:hypothetical protein
LTIVKSIVEVVGSDNAVKFFEKISEVFNIEKENIEIESDKPITNADRKTIIQRVKERLAVDYLDLRDSELQLLQNYQAAKRNELEPGVMAKVFKV